ncbi:MAG: hypothetical protein QM813_15695 [Verrucomicrobiota bacterium]
MAQSYEAAVTITQPTRIRTRVRNGTAWSALTDATFTPPQDLTKLVITEVMMLQSASAELHSRQ